MKKSWLMVVAGVISLSAFANVYDDVIWWFNGPIDNDGDGVVDTGDVVDLLHGGNLSDSSHKGTPQLISYIQSGSVSTHYFSRTLPYLHFEDSTDNKGAWILLNNQINAVHTRGTAFSGVFRFRWDGNSHSGSAWLFNLGQTSSDGGFLLGVNSGYLRVYPGASSPDYISALPVAKDTWYDLGLSVTKLAEGGCRLRFVLVKADGTTYNFTKDYTAIVNLPNSNVNWRLATESGSAEKKYFTGDVQQVAFWDRELSDAELVEAFGYQPPMPDEAGVCNASDAEFGGGATAAATFGSSAWKDYPSSLVKGQTASLTFTADAAPCAYALRVRSASGAATLKATAGGQEATAEIAAGETADLILPRTAFTAGAANTIALSRTDDGGTFTPDTFALVRQAKFIDEPISYTDDAVVTAPLALAAADHLQPIDVAEGKTVVYSGVISGDGGILKTGLGTLKFAVNNTFGGGVTVAAGRILSDDTTLTTPFGTGTVTVQQNGTGVCQAAVAGTLANAFVFTGSSTEAFPGLHFADVTTLSGTVDATEDLWMTTAWNDTALYADTVQVTLNGQITVVGTLALAPHCRVKFNKTISCDTLDLRWAANSATADGGNPGAVVLASCGDKTTGIACPMRKVKIDQTRIIQNGVNIFGGRNSAPYGIAELEWTGLHKTGGSINMNGAKMGLGKIITPPTTADDETSMMIFNPGGSVYLNFYETPTSTLYLRIVGSLTVSLSSSADTITFANRHQSFTTCQLNSSSFAATGGTRFDAPIGFDVQANGASVAFKDMTDPEALRKVTSFAMRSYGSVSFDAVSFASLPQDYSLTLTSNSSNDPTFTFPSADSVLKVKRFLDRNYERGPGKYQESDRTARLQSHIYPSGAQIWVSVADATAASGTLTWDAADEVWKDGDGQTVTDVSFARYATARCAFSGADGAATATLPDTLFAQDLDLTTTGGGVKTLAGVAGSRVQVKGDLTLSGGADYVFKPRMDFGKTQTFALGTERSLAFDGGLSSSETNVIESGTVSVSGELDGTVFVKGGATLALNGAIRSLDSKQIIMETKSTDPVAHLLLNGVTLEKPVSLGSIGSMGVFVLDATGDKSVTNVFAGMVTDSGSTSVSLRQGYTYKFLSADFAGKHEFYTMGRVSDEVTTVICSGSIAQGYRSPDGYLQARDSVHLVLDCAGLNSRQIYAVDSASVVEFCRDGVLSGSYLKTANAALLDCGVGSFLLNGTYQRCGALQGSASSTISGDAGSAIEICLGGGTTCASAFEGEVSVVMNGTGTQKLTGVSTSTGALIVRQGTLEIGANASWANASQVVLEGGTLSVLRKKAFGFDTTELILAGGQISGRAKFGSGKVKTADGTVLPDGVYGPESGWVAEGGSVTIGTMGMMIIVR